MDTLYVHTYIRTYVHTSMCVTICWSLSQCRTISVWHRNICYLTLTYAYHSALHTYIRMYVYTEYLAMQCSAMRTYLAIDLNCCRREWWTTMLFTIHVRICLCACTFISSPPSSPPSPPSSAPTSPYSYQFGTCLSLQLRAIRIFVSATAGYAHGWQWLWAVHHGSTLLLLLVVITPGLECVAHTNRINVHSLNNFKWLGSRSYYVLTTVRIPSKQL